MLLPAYERLASFIMLSPYNENPALIGYAGLLCHLLARQETIHEMKLKYEGYALVHLFESLRIDSENSSFLALYIDVLPTKHSFSPRMIPKKRKSI